MNVAFQTTMFQWHVLHMAHEYYHMRQQNSRTDEHITFSSAPFTGSPLCHPSVWLFQPDFLGSPSGQEAGLVSCFQSSGTFLSPVSETFLTEYPSSYFKMATETPSHCGQTSQSAVMHDHPYHLIICTRRIDPFWRCWHCTSIQMEPLTACKKKI